MKKIAVMLLAVLGFSAAVMADNLVMNGDFEKLNKNGLPVGWICKTAKHGTIKAVPTGAPDGGSVTFTLPQPGYISMQQNMTKVLKPNTKYEISFKVRGKDFKADKLCMFFINEGWTQNTGFRKFAVTSDWKEYKGVYTTPNYKKLVFLIFYASKATGTIEICDVEVETPDND